MGILFGLVAVMIVLMVIAYAFPIIWPLVITAGENITSMTGTDAGTTMMVGFWPVILLVVGIGVAVGLLVFVVKKFRIQS